MEMLRCCTACWWQMKKGICFCTLMDLGALSGQIRVIPAGSDSVVEVNIHRFEVIGVGMVAVHVFLICREH